jgi:predicted Zn-dependent peptidase
MACSLGRSASTLHLRRRTEHRRSAVIQRSFVLGAFLAGTGSVLLAQGSWEDLDLEGGLRATVVECATAPVHAVFTILPHGLLSDGPGEEQLSHLAEHMLIRSTDPDSLEPDGMRLNGETTALGLRLESIGPPATWQAQLERHARWLSASEIDAAVLGREKGRIREEEVYTTRAAFTHKWAEVAWNQVVRHGRESASVSGVVERAGADDLARFIERLPRSGRGVRIASIGPAPAAEVKEAVRRLLGERKGSGRAPVAPAAGADAVRKTQAREAVWDLDARHWIEWYPLPDEGPEDRVAGQVVAALLGPQLAMSQGLEKIGSRAYATADLVTPEGRWLALSASLPGSAGVSAVEAEIRSAAAGALRPAFAFPGVAGVAKGLADQAAGLPDFTAMRTQLAGRPGAEFLEAQHVLSVIYREISTGLSRDELIRALRGLDPARVEAIVRERLTPAARSTLLLHPASGQGKETASGEGFVPLFNGKDLSGWVNANGAPGTWRVEDGMIITTGKPICVLRTEKQYEDFIVELEWRHMVKGGNAGFFVWSDALPAKGQPFTRSVEVQVLDGRETESYTSHGDVFPIHGAVMTPDRPHPAGWARCLPSEKRARPSPEWNHYRITGRQGTLKLEVNGKEVSGGYGISPRKGYLCLESEGSEAHFRNIRIRELEPPATRVPLAPEDVAAADEGFRPLYTGVDLSGWKVAEGDEAHWKPDDWRLRFDGKGETIWTEEEFADFVLVADCRAAKEPVPGEPSTTGELFLVLRGRPECLIHLPARDTSWRRVVVRVKGDSVRVDLDGKLLTETATCTEARRGRIGLGRKGTGAVELANLLVKPLL